MEQMEAARPVERRKVARWAIGVSVLLGLVALALVVLAVEMRRAWVMPAYRLPPPVLPSAHDPPEPAAPSPPSGVTHVRAAHLWMHDGRWELVPGSARYVPYDATGAAHLEFGRRLADFDDVAARFVVPGMPFPARADDRSRFFREDVTATFSRGRHGDQFGAFTSRTVRHGHGMSSTTGNVGDVQLPVTFSPDFRGRGGSTPDPARNDLVLLRPERPGDGAPTEFTLADWRAAIATDLARVADATDGTAPGAFQEVRNGGAAFSELLSLAAVLRVPEARPALLRLRAAVPAWPVNPERVQLVALAALQAGEPEARTWVQGALSRAPNVPMGALEFVLGSGAEYWVRLLCQTDDPAIRDLATTEIVRQGLSADTATDLARAVAAGVAPESPGIRQALAGAPPFVASRADALRANAAPVALCLFVDAILLGMTVLLAVAVARQRTALVLRAGGALVVGGTALWALDVRVAGLDLLPEWFAAGVAAVGALGLRRAVPASHAGRVAVSAFLLAAVAVTWIPDLGGAALFVALTATAVLGRDLLVAVPQRDRDLPRRPGARVSPRLLLVVLPVALTGVFTLSAVLRIAGRVELESLAVLAVVAFAAWTLAAFAPAYVGRDPTRPRDALPRAFLACYVVPLVVAHLWSSAVALGGAPHVRLGQPWTGIALTAMTLAVIWALFRAFDAAVTLARAVDQP